jgi:hypothetical protein
MRVVEVRLYIPTPCRMGDIKIRQRQALTTKPRRLTAPPRAIRPGSPARKLLHAAPRSKLRRKRKRNAAVRRRLRATRKAGFTAALAPSLSGRDGDLDLDLSGVSGGHAGRAPRKTGRIYRKAAGSVQTARP